MADPKDDIKKDTIEAIRKPLLFASKDDFSKIENVKGLESLIPTLCDKLKDDLGFGKIKKLFISYDSLSIDEKKKAISSAISILDGKTETTTTTTTKAKTPSESLVTLSEVRKNFELLDTSLQYMKGIGPKLSERLTKKGLNTVEDMLFYLPLRYEDRRNSDKIAKLQVGETVSGVGEIVAMGEARYGKRKLYEMVLTDGTGLLKLKWFNYRVQYMSRYKEKQWVRFFGSCTAYGKQKEIVHPDLEIVGNEERDEKDDDLKGFVPVYSAIDTMHQKTIRKFVATALDSYLPLVVSGTTAEARSKSKLSTLSDAVNVIHNPPSENPDSALELAKKSLIYDELFMLELGLAIKRLSVKKEGGIAFEVKGSKREGFIKNLPFKLTSAQVRTIKEIDKDMASPHPMNRLVQGDVGSGKTAVSIVALLNAVDTGMQGAIMAPTEILAEQHYLLMHRELEELGVRTVLLKGSMGAAEKREVMAKIADGSADIIVGTHALIQKDVTFKNLGVAVIDEQHRFGVEQRGEIKKKGSKPDSTPDILVMTATPIPRTLSLTVFGDLDVSIIDELPPGRTPIDTKLYWQKERDKAYKLIKDEIAKGHQAYIVYPLVDESDELDLKSATEMKAHLENDIFPDLKLSLLHGRMKGSEKEEVMREFKARKSDILVATTVIEVGIDVPNATVMVIEHAERFGLSQLHQLRGRVGRGGAKGYCLLLAEHAGGDDTKKRLKVMCDTTDGFKIAEADLEIRGPGDFLGTRQSGLPDFRTPYALSNLPLLKSAREDAMEFLEHDPNLTSKEGEILKVVLKRRWQGRLELAQIA